MLPVDPARFLADLHALRAIGAVSTGCVRPAFSAEDIDGRRRVAEWMRRAGLAVHWDGIGNVVGLPPGEGRPLLLGSHTDTQPEGGWLDGALGVIAALEVARAAIEAGGPPIAVMNFQDEEGRFGGLTGSSVWTGAVPLATARDWRDGTGTRLGDLADEVPECRDPSPVPPDRFRGYLELHIEQGPVLETAAEQAGVVEAIVGLRQLTLTLTGQQNHAGTTPMHLRRDALQGLMAVSAALDAALAPLATPATVWTIGEVHVSPNAGSIVPGRVVATVQWRDAADRRLDAMETAVRKTAARVAADRGLGATLSETQAIAPAAMDAGLVQALSAAAEATCPGRWRRMGSGAIHDAGPVSRIMPAAMLFCPSKGGISHSFAEDTAEADLVAALHILARAAATA